MDLKTLKKAELIKILTDEYGHEEKEIKTLTNGKLIALIEQEKADIQEVEKVKTTAKPKTNLDKNYLVPIKCGVRGMLQYQSPTSALLIEFGSPSEDGYGQTDEIEFSELQTMLNRKPKFIREFWIVIDDEDAIRELKLEKLYSEYKTEEQLEELFRSENFEQLKEVIEKSSMPIKTMIAQYSMKRYHEGTLYDSRIIRLVQDSLRVTLDEDLV